jgi:eukaryotic-like serine/threonine-protein kinase
MLPRSSVSLLEVQSDPNSLVGTIVAERYYVEQLLGAGAMGRVYRARHVHMQKHVALKVLHRQTSENAELVTRFEREAVAAGRVSHPNVAGATDFGRLADGAFYLVLEYVSGRSLGSVIEEQGALPIPRALGIGRQIFAALGAAHRANIVHRDLKPDNVMLLSNSSTGSSPALPQDPGLDIVKVLDFGLAKFQSADSNDTQLTQAGAIYGTPQYMAPEQATGADVDARADLYAAGVILYEMLAGRPPFEAEQIMPLLLMHMTDPPPPLPQHIPREVRQVVVRLLEKKPEQRYSSAEEVLLALDRLNGADGPASTSGPGSSSRFAWTPAALLFELRQRAGPTLAGSTRFLARPVRLGRFRVQFWIPAWVGVGVVLVATWAWLSSGDEKASATAEVREGLRNEPAKVAEANPPTPSGTPADWMDADLMKVIEAAKLGSDPALYALEHRADADRSDVEWMALVQAYLMRREVEKALAAYGHALDQSSAHGSDMNILGALRYLVDDEKLASPILEFVAQRLPDVAADFLFDVWSKTSAKTKATEKAKDLLDSSEMKAHYSEALGLAFAVRESSDCRAQKELLPKLILRGDERSLPRLREMKREPECAKLSGKNLDEALTQVALRKAPRFPLLRRWRWKTAGSVAPGETVEDRGERRKKFIFF